MFLNHLNISILASPTAWGGMEAHTAELARALEAKGHEVSIIEVGSNLYRQRMLNQREKMNVISSANSKLLGNPGLFKSVRILHKLKGGVLLFPKGWFCDGSWYFDLIARLKFSHYITIEHAAFKPLPPKCSGRYLGGLLPGLGIWWYKAKLDYFLRSLCPHRVICVSDAVAKILIYHHHFSPKKVTTLCNGVDASRFQPRTDYRTAFRSMWGIPHDALVFGAIGRLSPAKGFDLALKLFKKLVSSDFRNNAWFVLVGDGPEYKTLKGLAEHPDIKDKVKLIGITDRPWEIYPALDVFLMPSHNEGLPLALLEAMACGCCPIAMGVGGIPEVITDPGLGWLVKPNNNLGFFEAMKEAAEIDSTRLREMGRKAREHVALHFEARRQFLALVNLIEEECRD